MDICTMLEHQLCSLGGLEDANGMQWGFVIIILHIWIRAMLQQKFHHIKMAVLSPLKQCAPPVH
jgi:hypothetical protein